MFAVLFVVSLMFFAPAAAADCFDDTPKTPFEEVVCADPELSALLADINDLYERLEKASLKPMPLKTERKNWLKKTEKFSQCPEKNPECLLDVFEKKKERLSKLAPTGTELIKLSGNEIKSEDFPFSPTAVTANEDGKIFLTVRPRSLSARKPIPNEGNAPSSDKGFILARYAENGRTNESIAYIEGEKADFPLKIRIDANDNLWISGRMNSLKARQSAVLPFNKSGHSYFLAHLNPDGTKIKTIRPFNLFSRFIDFYVNPIGDLTMMGDYQDRTVFIFFNTRTEGYENAFFLPSGNEYEAFVPADKSRRFFYVTGRTKKEGQATEKAFKSELPITRESAFVALYDIKTQDFKAFTYLDDFRPTLLSFDKNSVCITGETATPDRLKPYLTENAEYVSPYPYVLACFDAKLYELRYFGFFPVRPKEIKINKTRIKIIGID